MQSGNIFQTGIDHSVDLKPGVDRCWQIHRYRISFESNSNYIKIEGSFTFCHMVDIHRILFPGALLFKSARSRSGNILQICVEWVGEHHLLHNWPNVVYCDAIDHNHCSLSLYHALFKRKTATATWHKSQQPPEKPQKQAERKRNENIQIHRYCVFRYLFFFVCIFCS